MLDQLIEDVICVSFPGQAGGDHFFWDTFERAEFIPVEKDWCPPNCFHDGIWDVRGHLTVWREGQGQPRVSIVYVNSKYFLEKVAKAQAGEDGYFLEMEEPPPVKSYLPIFTAAVAGEELEACSTQLEDEDIAKTSAYAGERWFETIKNTEGRQYRFRINACDGSHVTEYGTLLEALMIAAKWTGYSLKHLATAHPSCRDELWGGGYSSSYIERNEWL